MRFSLDSNLKNFLSKHKLQMELRKTIISFKNSQNSEDLNKFI